LPEVLIRNCRSFLGPSGVDVLIDERGRIGAVEEGIEPSAGATVIEAEGALLSPGWLDMHAHVYYGATDFSVRPSQAGLASGVTAIVDTGSAGEANFHGFREYVAEPASERVYSLLNIGSIGLVAANRVSELALGIRSIDLDRSVAVIEANRDLIKGVKVRASHVIAGDWGITPLKLAKKLARRCRLPLMVHVGEPPPMLEEVFAALDPGDIVTHCYNGKIGGNIYDDRASESAAREAHERGVLFDVGHGGASFSYAIAERAIGDGLTPHTISTDLHGYNILGPVYDLATTVSKMLHVGLSLEDAIRAITFAPDEALHLSSGRGNWLDRGSSADLTLFTVEERHLRVADSQGEVRTLERLVVPRYSVVGTLVTRARNRYLELSGRDAAVDA
jgi:dihydroorotase